MILEETIVEEMYHITTPAPSKRHRVCPFRQINRIATLVLFALQYHKQMSFLTQVGYKCHVTVQTVKC